jgi:hypothetical protein
MSSTNTHSRRGGSIPRTAIQVAMAAVITTPAALNALSGNGTPASVLLVFVLVLSAIWILSAVAMSASTWLDRFMVETGSARRAPAPVPAATNTAPNQTLGRIPVAQVPADQAMHADEHGNLTAASTTGDMR